MAGPGHSARPASIRHESGVPAASTASRRGSSAARRFNGLEKDGDDSGSGTSSPDRSHTRWVPGVERLSWCPSRLDTASLV